MIGGDTMKIDAMKLPGRILGAALLAALASTSCRAPGASLSAGADAQCPVCRHEGDLACVNVTIEPDTPTCKCNGETYYFCSEECRAEFQEDPAEYLGD